MNRVIKNAFVDAIGGAIYIILVALFLHFLERNVQEEVNTVLLPIAMLLLFVFSAAFTGILILGRPVLWYIDGKKREAISLVAYTLLILLIIIFIVFILLAVYFNLFN